MDRADYHIELINGREIQKLLPKRPHVLLQRFLIVQLARDLPDRYIGLPELNILTGAQTEVGRREYIVPDVAVVRRDARYKDGDLADPPVFAVEILSPGQTISDLFVRSARLLMLGSPVVWVIWPERRKAWMHSNDDLSEATGSLSAPLLDGDSIEVNLAEMWAELD